MAEKSGKSVYQRTFILVIVIAGSCVIGAAIVLFLNEPAGVLRAALAGVAFGVAVVAALALLAVRRVRERLDSQLSGFRDQIARGHGELHELTDRAMRGERLSPPSVTRTGGQHAVTGPLQVLAYELGQVQQAAGLAIARVAEHSKQSPAGREPDGPDRRVEVVVNLARRMQKLVHREIEMIDALESGAEDPDLLAGLFQVDHLATRMRRQTESLAVVSGSAAWRQWTQPVPLHDVLRAATAEVEQYTRVRVVAPVKGTVHGPAVTDIVHLVAELAENATKFSEERTQVMVRAQPAAAGIAVEVEDLGRGMAPEEQRRANEMLSDPGRADPEELLRAGRIGLYIAAALARRHAIQVQLKSNIYGGISATALLPETALAGPARPPAAPPAVPVPEPKAPQPAPVLLSAPVPEPGPRLAAPVFTAREQVPAQPQPRPRPGTGTSGYASERDLARARERARELGLWEEHPSFPGADPSPSRRFPAWEEWQAASKKGSSGRQ